MGVIPISNTMVVSIILFIIIVILLIRAGLDIVDSTTSDNTSNSSNKGTDSESDSDLSTSNMSTTQLERIEYGINKDISARYRGSEASDTEEQLFDMLEDYDYYYENQYLKKTSVLFNSINFTPDNTVEILTNVYTSNLDNNILVTEEDLKLGLSKLYVDMLTELIVEDEVKLNYSKYVLKFNVFKFDKYCNYVNDITLTFELNGEDLSKINWKNINEVALLNLMI